MKEVSGDLWEFNTKGKFICIPTNGNISKDGFAIMGKGLALQCSERFKDIEQLLGTRIKRFGNFPHLFNRYRIISFPTKYNWKDNADISLIKTSATLLIKLVETHKIKEVFLPRVGCGEGRLEWDSEVKPILTEILDDRFVIVKYKI